MKKEMLIEYSLLLVAVVFLLMSSWMLFKYFVEAASIQTGLQLSQG